MHERVVVVGGACWYFVQISLTFRALESVAKLGRDAKISATYGRAGREALPIKPT